MKKLINAVSIGVNVSHFGQFDPDDEHKLIKNISDFR
jgi:hypothetical protein